MSAPRPPSNPNWREPTASGVAGITLLGSWPGERLIDLIAKHAGGETATKVAQVATQVLPYVLVSSATLAGWLLWSNRDLIADKWREFLRPWKRAGKDDDTLVLDTEIPDAANEPKGQLPILSQLEVARRTEAIEQMYDVLNNQGVAVSKRGGDLADTLRTTPPPESPTIMLRRVAHWRSSVQALVNRINAVHRKFSIRADVYPGSLREMAFQTPLHAAVTNVEQVLLLLERWGDKAHPDSIQLADAQIRVFEVEVVALQQWVDQHLSELKRGLEALLAGGVDESA